MSLCELRHCKKVLETSFLKNDIFKFRFETLIVSFLRYSSNDNEVHNQNMNATKIVITNFRGKLQKISFIFSAKFK